MPSKLFRLIFAQKFGRNLTAKVSIFQITKWFLSINLKIERFMMSEIIVGIDFSSTSLVALRLAVDISNRTGANILMVWIATKEMDSEDAKDELYRLSAEYGPKLHNQEIRYQICEGKIHKVMASLVKTETPDLIVIGAHGKGGFDESYAGHNTFKIVQESGCPTLIVRENFNFNKPLEKIILPIDSSQDTRQKVPWTIEFAKMFPQTTICVLGIFTTSIKTVRTEVEKYVASVEDFLKKNNLPYTSEFADAENVTVSTIEYAKKINADLIVIMTEQEKTIANMLFLGPYAQQMINISPFPVLTVPPTQINNGSR